MGAERDGIAGFAGEKADDNVDVAALFAQLSEEVRRVGPGAPGARGASPVRLDARAAAERLWRVSADRPLGGRSGWQGSLLKPVKHVVRRLTRWYVEPVFADQRAFNDAMLKLIDDLTEEVERLKAELAARPAGGAAP